MRYFYKLKYQVPKFLAWLRPYLGSNLLVIARKAEGFPGNAETLEDT
jgi:hypothetical protein